MAPHREQERVLCRGNLSRTFVVPGDHVRCVVYAVKPLTGNNKFLDGMLHNEFVVKLRVPHGG